MGACDRSAWSLATLAYYGGLDCHIVYLFRDPALPSNHTVMEVKTERGWQVVDPFNNRIYDEGAWDLSKKNPYYKNCSIYLNPVEAHALLPVVKLAEMICRAYVPDQRMFFDVEEAAKQFG